MFKNLRLKSRLLLSFFLITCISTFATTSFAIYYFSDKIRLQAQEGMGKNIQVAQLLYDNRVQRIKSIAERLGKDNSLSLIVQFIATEIKIRTYLTQILHDEAIHQIILLDPELKPLNGQVFAETHEYLQNDDSYSHNALLQQVRQAQTALAASEEIKSNGQQWISISAASPIRPSKQLIGNDQSTVLGFVLVRYVLNQDHQLVNSMQTLLGITASIFHQEQAIAYKREALTEKHLDPPQIAPKIYQALMQGQEDNAESIDMRLHGELAQYQTLYDVQKRPIAILGISMLADPFIQTTTQATFTLVMIMLICILIASLLGYWLARSILGPLEKLLHGVKRLTSGDLSYEIAVDLRDELGMLATAFNSMSRQLKELFDTLEQRVENATRKLQNTLAHLGAIIDNMADGLLVTDQEGKIIRLNPALSAMFVNRMGIQDQPCADFNPQIAKLVSTSQKYKDTVHSAEIALDEGRIGQAAVTAIMHKDSFHETDAYYTGSQYIGSVVLVRDITREKEVDAMLKNTIDTLTRTGTALASETNMNKLLEMFVKEARGVCHADGGTLYTLENQKLQFKIVQNDSMGIFMGGTSNYPITLPPLELDDSKIAAYCARHKVVVKAPNIADNQDFDFSSVRQYDAEMGYQTLGMLAVPLLDRKNHTVGVLQLINPRSQQTEHAEKFDKNQIEIISSLASQAAVAIENVRNHEKIERKNAAFKRFVPTEFIRRLNKQEIEDIDLGDAAQTSMSVLFSDIRSFTSLSEAMTPEQTFDFLNEYLKHIGPNIVGNRGFIDKYIGDAIMALFSGERLNAADDAVAAAVGMVKSLDIYNQKRQRQEQYPINIGIGIHTGPLTLGTLGFEERIETTVIGDSVNLASRMEGLTKQYGIQIGITEATFHGLVTPHNYLIREIDTVQVKGKTRPITIYEVFDGDAEPIRTVKQTMQSTYESALRLYQQRDWAAAKDRFASLLDQLPEDLVLQIYTDRCTRLSANPPQGQWTGITQLTQK